jgi:hypothetical protein
VGLEQGTPFGNSVQTLATYFRYTHAISYNRLSSMFKEIYNLDISEGGLANLFKQVSRFKFFEEKLKPRKTVYTQRLKKYYLVFVVVVLFAVMKLRPESMERMNGIEAKVFREAKNFCLDGCFKMKTSVFMSSVQVVVKR